MSAVVVSFPTGRCGRVFAEHLVAMAQEQLLRSGVVAANLQPHRHAAVRQGQFLGRRQQSGRHAPALPARRRRDRIHPRQRHIGAKQQGDVAALESL